MLDPLGDIPGNATLKAALAAYQAAPPSLQEALDGRVHEAALEKARFPGGLPVGCPPGRYGPVAPMMARCSAWRRAAGSTARC